MKLSKRVAVGVLAAAMALSVMTGCNKNPPASSGSTGTGSGSNTSQTGNGSGNNNSSSKKDDTTTPPKDNNDKNDVIPVAQTRAEKFFSGKYAINGSKWTYTAQIKTSSLDKGETYSGIETYTTDGRRLAECFGGDSVVMQDFQENRIYSFSYTNSDEAVFIQDWETNDNNTSYGRLGYDVLYQAKINHPSLREFANEYKVGTYKVDGVDYYSESYINNYGEGSITYIYCFDTGDIEGRNLRYFIELDRLDSSAEIAYTYVCKVMSISNTFDEKLLQVPEGREVYRYVNGESIKQDGLSPKDNYPN